jgi:hypothetical protein
MGCFFRRTLFHDPRDVPPFFEMNDFTTDKVALDSGNLCSAIMASGAIPVAMEGVSGISGAPEGIYRDGGMIDYHMDIPFGTRGLVLYPHFLNRIIPGWFDKHIFWRKPSAASMSGMLMLAPSPEFVRSLPLEKIPDRDDFRLFMGRDRERVRHWRKTIDMCRSLGDEFIEAVHSGSIRAKVRPFAEYGA